MPHVTSESEWTVKIADWRNSGLSIAAWCRENSEGYYRFIYWRKRLQGTGRRKTGSFIPLRLTTTPLFLECNGIYVHFSPGFDAGLLKDVLLLLKTCN